MKSKQKPKLKLKLKAAMQNRDVAAVLTKVADLLDIEGANPFRVRAYRNAARLLANLPKSVAEMVERQEPLHELPGIGKDLAGKIADLVRTGELPLLAQIVKKTPIELAELMEIQSLGPKKVKVLYERLKIRDLAGLRRALEEGKVRELHGFGAKSEARMLEELARLEKKKQEAAGQHGGGKIATHGARVPYVEAEVLARPLLDYLRAIPGVKKVTAAGSYRRRRDTVGDLDIVVTCADAARVMDRFVAMPGVETILAHGPTRSTIILTEGLQVDVRIVPEVSYGAALFYFTGSKSFNIAVRGMGQKRGLKINEYGVYRVSGRQQRIGGKTEEEIFRSVGLPYIEPELRENQGEIEAASRGRLPKLIRIEDIRGDLHVHTNAGDGLHSLEEMAAKARAMGYSYLAIADHAGRGPAAAKGLDPKRVLAQIAAIDRFNESLNDKERAGFVLLKSAEVDILEDGTLDLPNSVLKQLDFTVCSVRSKFDRLPRKQTERLLKAMDNPYFTILGHPSNRLMGEREPMKYDFERVALAAKERGICLELNAQPRRLDLNDVDCRMARDMGVKISIATDAHSAESLALMPYGIAQARRGWLEPGNVINTRRVDELRKILKKL